MSHTLSNQRQSLKTHNPQKLQNNFTKGSNTHIQASNTNISTETHNPRYIWEEV